MDQEVTFEAVNEIIQKEIKSFIEADGGKIELAKVEKGRVYVKLSGACAGCPAASMTLKFGVERILKEKLPGIESVELAF